MFQRKSRRFNRGRSNGRGHRPRPNGESSGRIRTNSFSNNHSRNNFRSNQNVEKLFEKYNLLAKEALSAGDKTLSENYFQHADHFMRVIEEKNKNKIISNSDDTQSSTSDNKIDKVEKAEEVNKKE